MKGEFKLDLETMDGMTLGRLSNDKFRYVLQSLLTLQQADRKENQILYYKPASPDAAKVHHSTAKWVGISGGNGSSKTETALVHFMALATGVFPESIKDTLRPQFRGPMNIRIVVESFTTVLETIILPKLKWWVWTGVDMQGGDRGHWGWIPKTCLINGAWDRSYSQKLKVLTVICRNPDDPDECLGESQIQFCSKDQDPSDFASGDFHLILHDEPPLHAQWRENQARTMRVAGRIFLAFTWPDDPTIPCDWIHDEIYEKSQEPGKSEYHDWFELDTTKNTHLDQDSIAVQAKQWDQKTRDVRLYGKSMTFSSRIHPLFTDQDATWCLNCRKAVNTNTVDCPECGADQCVGFNHVVELEGQEKYPSVFLLDPHPRKPHMWLWVTVDPNDDLYCFAEGELASEPVDVSEQVFATETEFGLYNALRLIDPNMGRSPASTVRDITWQDEFDRSGLLCELSDDSSVGRKRVDEYLKVDPYTHRPRLHVHPRCVNTIHQIKRYRWSEYKATLEKDLKQVPRDKEDDYPTLLKYLLNYQPSFQLLKAGAPVLKRPGTRKGSY